MPGEAPPPAVCHGDGFPCPTGSDMACEEEEEEEEGSTPGALGPQLLLEPSEPHRGVQLAALSQDGRPSLDGFDQLERRWVLWHEFMKEHSHLDDWLRLAERTAASPNSAHVLFVTAKDELRKFESLRVEAKARLLQLDRLTLRSRALLRLFTGAARARLVTVVTDSSRRWDRLHAAVERVCRRLKHLVSQREEFEGGREQLMVWLVEMDLRLAEVEQLSGRSSSEKMKELQNFQEAVGENASRLNDLLERGEALIQRSQPEDGQDIEEGLQDLMLYCARVFEGVGRLHTRLLSMRLVYEDDWRLIPPSDSGCPSEAVLEEEGAGPERSSAPTDLQDPPKRARPSPEPPDAPPPPPSPPTLDHQVLEWDPSVDIGGSVSHDDEDSSYFSSNTGLCYRDQPLARDCLKRRSYISSLGSQSDITNTTADLSSERGCGLTRPTVSPPLTRGGDHMGGACLSGRWATSTPSGASAEPLTFDPAWVSAWLGQTPRDDPPDPSDPSDPSPPDPGTRPCSKAVQTDLQCSGCSEGSHSPRDLPIHSQPCRHDTQEACLTRCPARSCDCKLQSDWRGCRSEPKPQVVEAGRRRLFPGGQTRRGARPRGGVRAGPAPRSPLLPWLLLGALLALAAWLAASVLGPDRRYGNGLLRSSHLELRYVNGPPPT